MIALFLLLSVNVMEKQKRKMWSPESTEAAVELIKSGDGGL